jgi:hypothetical protein
MKKYVKLFESWLNEEESSSSDVDFKTLTIGQFKKMTKEQQKEILTALLDPFMDKLKDGGITISNITNSTIAFYDGSGPVVSFELDLDKASDDQNIFELDYLVTTPSDKVEATIKLPLYLDWFFNVKKEQPRKIGYLADYMKDASSSELSVSAFNDSDLLVKAGNGAGYGKLASNYIKKNKANVDKLANLANSEFEKNSSES